MMGKLKQFDWILVAAALLLVAIGLSSIYSSSGGESGFSNFKKQILFVSLGILLMFALSSIDWRIFRESSPLILVLYSVSLLALIGLFFFAPEIRGTRSWYKIGPFSIDPIEFTKIVLILLLAKYFSKRHIEMYRVTHILLSGLYVFLPACLIFFQPNFGSVIVIVSLWIGILIVSGIKLKHFLILALCGLLTLSLSWVFLMKDYQKARIIGFLSPDDPLGLSWSQNQAEIAVGSGGILGQGLGQGSQTQYGFLPEPQTDFIFASWAEETGLIGVLILLGLFAVLFWRIFNVAIHSQDNFSRLFAAGLGFILIAEFFIHIGMNLGLLPIIGIPLPLVSYGGSGLIATFCALGILQSIKKNS